MSRGCVRHIFVVRFFGDVDNLNNLYKKYIRLVASNIVLISLSDFLDIHEVYKGECIIIRLYEDCSSSLGFLGVCTYSNSVFRKVVEDIANAYGVKSDILQYDKIGYTSTKNKEGEDAEC